MFKRRVNVVATVKPNRPLSLIGYRVSTRLPYGKRKA